jgi:hypothetical protein
MGHYDSFLWPFASGYEIQRPVRSNRRHVSGCLDVNYGSKVAPGSGGCNGLIAEFGAPIKPFQSIL